MNTKQHTLETFKISCLIKISCLMLMLAWLVFAVSAWAQASQIEGAPEADVSEEQEASEVAAAQDAPDLRAPGSQAPGREARQQRKALLSTLRQVRQQERREYIARVRSEKAAAQKQAVASVASRPAAPLTGIDISFKMDPRITRSLYMGDLWISPPTYSGVQEEYFTVEARVQGRDAKGQPVNISPEWIPADPEMVTVSPSQGNAVQITVKRAGESSLEVTSQGVSRKLAIMAWYQGDALQVEISEKP